ncbi:hypothetical protein GOODEAATRI_023523 [Goodea atripinnis]|uniref:Phosphoinositide phospholipase C n=1 Tax=Goodea atripinnis TaxID=208336 RepID=A0ABV0MK65_9TELE
MPRHCCDVSSLVALNFQTPGEQMDLNQGRFLQNGLCGYVLKPLFMRQPNTSYNPENVGGGPGHRPVLLTIRWDCTFNFTVHVPDLALVRFVVEDHDYTSSNDFLGQFTLPFTSLRTGYRHVRLLKLDGSSLSPASLFIHVEVTPSKFSAESSAQSTVECSAGKP